LVLPVDGHARIVAFGNSIDPSFRERLPDWLAGRNAVFNSGLADRALADFDSYAILDDSAVWNFALLLGWCRMRIGRTFVKVETCPSQ
jgi:hypothetical protein